MSAREAALIAATSAPKTYASLRADLQHMGLGRPDDIVLMHVALSRIGWTCGGAETLLAALCDTILPAGGTLVMPAQSSHITDPAHWSSPPVPSSWLESIRANMPPFDPVTTPTRGVGIVAERFRTWPQVRRSVHPSCSFCAIGPQAETILREQPLDDPFGDASPLATLYRLQARILMIGVGFETCTALHLAERRARPDAPRYWDGMPTRDGKWSLYSLPETDIDRFPAIDRLLTQNGKVMKAMVGDAPTRLFDMCSAIDIATDHWRSEKDHHAA
ncbi:aminoglycoside N3-acetyltransferase [Neoasaia chiangmaiensis NBRC 101099]|uniref:Aminoglycoside N(3)-acetyltransferase n=1 Tax=Neoasaia chiangmaiensis TaxID=320497 RepID=A0A1U9KRP9_9PROT|nr:AAC(3) family N-acetyltransferase [Neoasaia chiangmaiensis]AQS88425.1 hypothetical protein A0U93_11285 [Neoasaia chiangmaiensis]GBR39275.1 aminoglycoside N3-acetyltransferase [Neoasaia chiangmaiensis NBRC 101099]GEN14503.1 AAC(3) family N-acetyltransferase [Neoasaia chiangmaiensis]